MPQLDQTHVLVENAIVVWDAITRPDVRDDGSKSHKLKVVIPPGSQDAQLVEAMAAQCLQESKWKGVMPNGGNFAISQVQPGDFNNMYNGGYVINPSTNRLPDIFDESGNRLDPMQYGNLLYGGQVVSVIVHCWDYDNKSKGIATGLDGVRIHTSLNAPRQQFGGGGTTRPLHSVRHQRNSNRSRAASNSNQLNNSRCNKRITSCLTSNKPNQSGRPSRRPFCL